MRKLMNQPNIIRNGFSIQNEIFRGNSVHLL